ncbi:hypothetical protein lerEdw1_013087 [Lerista edwardsae]|nr:hypothetical protein lerEdw1_013087 [Lerista edwardsae]
MKGFGGVADDRPCCGAAYLCASEAGSDTERRHAAIRAMESYLKPCSSSEDSFELQGGPRSDAKSFVKSKNKDEALYQSHRLKHDQKWGEKIHPLEHSALHPGKAGQKLQRQKKVQNRRSSSASDLSGLSQGSSSSLSVVEEKIEAKLKFSQFLNEVTFRVLDPMSLRAFRAAKLKSSLGSGGRSLDDLRFKKKTPESWKASPLVRMPHRDEDLESLRSDDLEAAARMHKLEKSLSLDAGPSHGRYGNGISCQVRPILPGETIILQSNEMPARKSASLPRSKSMGEGQGQKTKAMRELRTPSQVMILHGKWKRLRTDSYHADPSSPL